MKISEGVKKNLPSTAFKKGIVPWNKGTAKERYCEDCNKKIGRYHKNKKCRKCEGKTRRIRYCEDCNKFLTSPSKRCWDCELKFRKNHGRKHSLETIEKIKASRTEEVRKRISEGCKIKRAKQVLPSKDTKIELKIQGFLDEMDIEYFKHKLINDIENSYKCDIYVPKYNLVIECDGDYWHGNPSFYKMEELSERQVSQKKRDSKRTLQMIRKKYNVIRLWETEIKEMKINDFKTKIENLRGGLSSNGESL